MGRRMSLAFCAVAFVASCSTADQRGGIAEAELTDGRVVADLLDSSALSVVLVYSPSDCLACGGVLNRWLQLSRDVSLDVQLLLTERPSPAESAPLAFLRLEVAGFLADGRSWRSTPASYLFRGTQLADSASDLRSQRLLIDELSRRLGVASRREHPYPHATFSGEGY